MPSYSRKVDLPGKSSQELYDKVSADVERFMSKASIGNFDVKRVPEKKEVHIKASMVTATLICKEGSITLDAKLSLLAAPFRSKIDDGIDRWLEKTFKV